MKEQFVRMKEQFVISGITYQKGAKYALNELPLGIVIQFELNGASFRVCDSDDYGIWVVNEETGKKNKYAPEAEAYLLRAQEAPKVPIQKNMPGVQQKDLRSVEIRPLTRFDLLELE